LHRFLRLLRGLERLPAGGLDLAKFRQHGGIGLEKALDRQGRVGFIDGGGRFLRRGHRLAAGQR
jgi:hypothetical protein